MELNDWEITYVKREIRSRANASGFKTDAARQRWQDEVLERVLSALSKIEDETDPKKRAELINIALGGFAAFTR